jgi:hypothetical protein
MPSPIIASDISREDAKDILSKYITESTKLQVVLRTASGSSAALAGRLFRAAPPTLIVKSDNAPDVFSFNPDAARGFKFAAEHGSDVPDPLAAGHFSSSLHLIYPDSMICLLEFTQGQG